MIIIKAGNSYDISFNYKNNKTATTALNVIATATVGAGMTVNSITAVNSQNNIVGSQGLTPSEYLLGDTPPLSNYTITINVTVDVESEELPVTLSVTTDSPEENVSNNSLEKNLFLELDGILCSSLGDCLPSGGGSTLLTGEFFSVDTGNSIVLTGDYDLNFLQIFRNGQLTNDWFTTGVDSKTIVFNPSFGHSTGSGESEENIYVYYYPQN